MIRIQLPTPLRDLAGITGLLELDVEPPVTQRRLLDALEARHPVLRGTIRDHAKHERRAYVRFFACERDLSNDPPDAVLPDEVARGEALFIVLGAMAGG